MDTQQKLIDSEDSGDVEAFLRQARERADAGYSYWKDNFQLADETRHFLGGDQWPAEIKEDRGSRPALTINNLPQYKKTVIGEQRMNRPSVHVNPVEADANEAQGNRPEQLSSLTGSQDYSLSEVYEGIIRNIQYRSKFETKLDDAFENAIDSGLAWIRVFTDYVDSSSFDQDFKITSITDPLSVVVDPEAVEPDKSDMNWAFVFEKVPNDRFEKLWPGKRKGEIEVGSHVDGASNYWGHQGYTGVAEYFTREPAKRKLVMLSDGRVVWRDEVEPVLDELEAAGVTIDREREEETWKVLRYLITAHDILEKKQEWITSTIPLVPVFGEKYWYNKKQIYVGLIYHSIDAKRMHNYWASSATEKMALSPKAPWVGERGAFEGNDEWDTANTENHSKLAYNDGFAKPTRQDPTEMPAAELQMVREMSQMTKECIGMYETSVGSKSNETSGRAINARRQVSQVGNFTYTDNLNKAVEQVGRILVEGIPKIYDGERVARLRFDNGGGDWVRINQIVLDEETGDEIIVNDIGAGKFDVTVSAGPSYDTQREEAAEAMMGLYKEAPEVRPYIIDLLVKNMNWPGAKEMAERLLLLVPQEVLGEEERESLEKIRATPEPSEADKVAMELENKKLEAEMAKANATIAESQAKIEESRASGQIDEEAIRRIVAQALLEIGNAEASA